MTGPDTATQEPSAVRLRRISHPGRLIAFSAVVAAAIAIAFVAGLLVRAPNEAALQNADVTIPITAAVEERVIDDSFTLPAALTPAPETDLVVTEASVEAASTAPSPPAAAADGAPSATPPPASVPVAPPPAETDRVVLSAANASVGTALVPGALIGEVSGRPVIAWFPGTALYRDIVPGESGSDVEALQSALARLGFYPDEVDGEWGPASTAALQRLYESVGERAPYVQPGIIGVAWRELLPLPADSVQVLAVAPVGTQLSADVPLLRVQSATPTITAMATAREKDALAPGTEVGVLVAGQAAVRSTVVSLGAFMTDEDTGVSGYPLVVAPPADMPLTPGSALQLRPWATPHPTLAVPVIAIRQDARGTFVLAADATGTTVDDPNGELERVDVEVTAQAEGWAGINTSAGLRVGQLVLVSRE